MIMICELIKVDLNKTIELLRLNLVQDRLEPYYIKIRRWDVVYEEETEYEEVFTPAPTMHENATTLAPTLAPGIVS